jgi:hypothetical protein
MDSLMMECVVVLTSQKDIHALYQISIPSLYMSYV